GILIDPTAAGHGWFVNPSPTARPAQGRVDLLTVVEHEMGNVLGLPETKVNDIMGEFLPVGVRRLPRPADLGSLMINRPSMSITDASGSRRPALVGSLGIIPTDLVADVASLTEWPALLTGRKKAH